MGILVEKIYGFLCVIIPCLIYQGWLVKKHGRRSYLFYHLIWVNLLIFYLYLAIDVAGIGSIWDIGSFKTLIRGDEIHVIPFSAGIGITTFLNVIMFMPLGFLLPLIWSSYRNGVRVVVTGLLFSLSIEFFQLFNYRTTDIDDLLMNTLGAFFGYLIFLGLKRVFPQVAKHSVSLAKYESLMYLGLSILGTFLLFNWRFIA